MCFHDNPPNDPPRSHHCDFLKNLFVQYVNTITPSRGCVQKRHVYFPTSFLSSRPLTAEILFACAKEPYLPIITLHPSPGPAPGVTPPPGPPLDARSQGAIIPRSPSDSLSALGVRGLWAEHCGPCESCPPKSAMLQSSDNVTFTSGKLNRKVG